MGDSQRLCQVGQDLLVVPSRGISHHQRKANGAFKVTSPLLRLYGGSRGQLGQVCLAYLYSTLDTLSWVTLRQFVGPWKLFKVSSLFSSFVAPVLPILAIIFIHVLFRYRKSTHHALANCSYVFILQIIILQTVSIYLASYIRSSCKLHLFYKLSSCKLSPYSFLSSVGPFNMVSLLAVRKQILRASLRLGLISRGYLLMR